MGSLTPCVPASHVTTTSASATAAPGAVPVRQRWSCSSSRGGRTGVLDRHPDAEHGAQPLQAGLQLHARPRRGAHCLSRVTSSTSSDETRVRIAWPEAARQRLGIGARGREAQAAQSLLERLVHRLRVHLLALTLPHERVKILNSFFVCGRNRCAPAPRKACSSSVCPAAYPAPRAAP